MRDLPLPFVARSADKRSNTIAKNREGIAQELLGLAAVSITDVLSWDDNGVVTVKPSNMLKESAARSIKRVRTFTDKDGNQQIDIEMHDKISVLRILAKAAGLLEVENDSDRPSVIGINIRAPSNE